MATLDNEPDDLALERDEDRPASSGGWNKPLLLAGLGLALMLGGYAAMNYAPSRSRTPEQASQERLHSDIREWAAQQANDSASDAALAERLNRVDPPWRTPPYQIPGRLAIYGGLLLFVSAGVLMYRQTPPLGRMKEEG